MTIYSLDELLFLFEDSLLFHVQFWLLLPDLHKNFSRGRSGGLVSHLLQNFPQFIVIHTVKGFGIVNKTEIDFFFWNSLAFSMIQRMLAIWSLVPLPFLKPAWKSGSSWFKLLKPGLENFEHYFTSVWDECDCAVVWAFFGIAFLWDWNENWPFLFLWQNSITLNEYTKLIIHSTVNGAVRLFQVFGIVISFAKNILICLLEYVYKGWF